MDMNFLHPRKGKRTGDNKAQFAALVATATARQATSLTVGAMMNRSSAYQQDADILGSRIAFFAQDSVVARKQTKGGSFWSLDQGIVQENAELPVNLSGSTKGNEEERDYTAPETQGAQWGTEL